MRRRGTRPRGKGQALVEFALVLPIFLLILMLLVDFGRVIYAQHTINQDAAEAARVGAVSADNLTTALPAGCTASPESPVGCDTRFSTRFTKIRNAAKIMAPAVPMTDANITGDPAHSCSTVLASTGGTPSMPNDSVTPAATAVTNSCFYPNGTNNTNTATPPRVTVNIQVQVSIITPIISHIVGGQITLRASASQLLQ
jgi:hypothetical protein